LVEIERDKLRVARAYSKRVKENLFQVRDLVWKMILPIRSKRKKLGSGHQIRKNHIELRK
jgi:hypothetical protein